ncbi:unnamed protein product [Ceratitis capitata]|uniref:(Mediterranean fruit fly) hypothetical protein n=1 Tax=Ceratitis capitata TaxID=7213 RepID=A0A811UAR4_CERCA|nr:unnamed protein product [Ceratitis capitata]
MREIILRAAELNREGTIFNKIVELLAYADDIDIIGLNNRAVSSASSRLDKEAKRMGLVVNEGKTKSLLSSNKQLSPSRLGSHVTVGSHNFKVEANFVYLGTNINTNNNVSLFNKCYFGRNETLQVPHRSRPTIWYGSMDDDSIL